MNRTYKYRVYPSEGQLKKLTQWDHACRYLANLSLEQWKLGLARPKGERKYPKFVDSCRELTEIRKEVPWLADLPTHIAQTVLYNVENSWKRCFSKGSRPPRWKCKGKDTMSFTEPESRIWKLDSKRQLLHFPKLGNIRVNLHRPLQGKPSSCTLKRTGNAWYATICVELTTEAIPTHNSDVIGLDRGIVLLVADSDGATFDNPQSLKKSLEHLKKVQRKASRKKKHSANQKKAYRRVAQAYGRVARCQMKYKAEAAGGKVVEVPAAYSSQECSECGCVDSQSRASQALFSCTSCGHTENADLNAAKVIKKRTIRSLLTGEGSAPEAPRRTSKSRLRNRTQGKTVKLS